MTNLTDIFSTSPRCKRTRPLEAIPAALENGVIYNVDFKDLKEAVNQALEAAWGAAVKNLYLSHEDRRERYDWVATDNLYYGQGPQIHNLKSVIKKIGKVEKIDPKCDLIAPARAICELVAPVIEDMNKLKGMIVMGRKPSTEPRLTPERTLDNTGTCAVCEMNVKLDKGQHIVAHGYTIQWGFQSGNCHGVGFKPIELSSEGAVSWKGILEASLAHAEENLQSLRDAYEVDKNRTTRMAVSQAEATIRFAPRDIEMFEKRIATWEAKPLPDAKK